MNWWRCWFGWHRWERAETFAGYARRECCRCGISQGHTPIGWVTEDAELCNAVRYGLELQAEIKRLS